MRTSTIVGTVVCKCGKTFFHPIYLYFLNYDEFLVKTIYTCNSGFSIIFCDRINHPKIN